MVILLKIMHTNVVKKRSNDYVLYQNEHDYYNKNGYKEVTRTHFDFKLDAKELDSSTYDDSQSDFVGYAVIEKFFFLILGGVLVFIILTIVFKCCSRKNETSTNRRQSSQPSSRYHRSNHVTVIDNSPTFDIPDVITLNHISEDELDLPPSYDISTENSRHNSTNNLHDSGECTLTDSNPPPCYSNEDDCAPPSYSEVCGSDNVD